MYYKVFLDTNVYDGVNLQNKNREITLCWNLFGCKKYISRLKGIDELAEEKGGVEHLIYASSSSVYGSNKKIPYSTDDKVDNPVSLYAATKKSNELFAHDISPF